MSTRRIRRRAFSAVTAASACVLLLGTLAPTASAGETGGLSIDEYVRMYDHPLGSQIAKVEGDQSTPATRQEALRVRDIGPDGRRVLASVPGIDVSGWQKNVDWQYWWNQGKRFAYVKATEGTGYKSPYFAQQYNGSYNIGMIRGAYHFALPDRSSGAAQANYFVDNGGGWSGDGKTLPGALDMEYNPYGSTCYGKSKAGMAAWIRDFHDTYANRTGRWPVIYTSKSWWDQCVATGHGFGQTVPLWVARYSSTVGALPNGWGFYTFWQYTSSPIDQNTFNGSYDRLKVLATG
ncbi:lysozyme [Amycolatopsis cihanbeyliensis]|uniref:lysozyme n=1 Tax=Amycolatopsis cihanbeyliensis TaxID=1128664 RepID=A0A542DKD9_AMYCI|nr:lysozyme [Amycolatopsis cihanbeyliensis]TQJ03558.1 GH25 family lysozyme M1 (1,4-beta-N-acetylmuramidase) [Amycolatopsis cihanbeyliensis]